MARYAVLMQGTLREAAFLGRLLPFVVGDQPFDLYLCIRQTEERDVGRVKQPERLFSYEAILPALGPGVHLCVLPPVDPGWVKEHFLIPVGPTDEETEIHVISMFLGIFAGVDQIRSSGRTYDYIVRTRTDYLFQEAPLFDILSRMHSETGGKIIVDRHRTAAIRYQDNPHLPWQGSIGDLFSFSSAEQFFRIWDFRERLPEIWTGVSETTFFRNMLYVITGESVQHPRKNQAFLERYLHVLPGEFTETSSYFRHGILSPEAGEELLGLLRNGGQPHRTNLELVWAAYHHARSPSEASRALVLLALEPFAMRESHLLICGTGVAATE